MKGAATLDEGVVRAHDSEHWTEHGTGLTNFSSDQFGLYIEAVKRFGDPLFIVSERRMLGRGREGAGGSLHYLGKFRTEECWQVIREFWNTFRAVQEELKCIAP